MNIIKDEEQLVSLGFTKYPRLDFDKDYILYRYQKRYTDDLGIKYFIDCRVIDWSDIPYNPQKDNNISFVFECQLYHYGTHDPLNIEFFTKDIDEITKFIESMFEAKLIEHYRLWEDN